MPEANLFLLFSRLNTLGVAYMVSGSVAVIIYGEPRLPMMWISSWCWTGSILPGCLLPIEQQ